MSETDREVTISIRGKNITDPAFKGVRENLLGLWKDTDRVSASTRAAKPGLDGLGTSAKGLFAELERGRGSLKGFGGGLDSGVGSMMGMVRSSGLLRLGLVGGGAAGVVGALGAVAHWASESAQEIRGIAAATDLSVPFIQRLSVVAASSGKQVQQFTDTLQMFGQRVAGGEDSVVRAAEKLGVSWLELRKQSPEAQLDTLIPKLAAVGDAQERNRLINELFGKSGKETIPKLIQNWEELKVAVVTSTDEQLAVFDRWESATVRMAENWKTRTRNMIADAMLMAEEMATGFANAGKNIATGVTTVTTGGVRAGLFNMFGARMNQSWVPQADAAAAPPKVAPPSQADLLSREDAKAAAMSKAALEEIRISKLRGVADDELRVKFGLTRQEMAAVERRITSMTAAQREATQAGKARAEELKREEQAYQDWKQDLLGVSKEQQRLIEWEKRAITEGHLPQVAALLKVEDQTAKIIGQSSSHMAAILRVGESYHVTTERMQAMYFQMGRIADFKTIFSGAMSTGDLLKGVKIPDPTFGQNMKGSMKGLLTDAPMAIMGALQGGGSVGKSLGGLLGGGVTDGVGKTIASALGKKVGSAIGGVVGSVIPVFGTMIGAALGGMIGGAFGPSKTQTAGREATKNIDELQKKLVGPGGLFKDFNALEAKAKSVGLSFQDIWSRKGVDGLKLLQERMQAFDAATKDSADAQEFLNATIQKYGFSIEELGPKWRAQRMKEDAQLLLREYTALTAAGVDHETVQKKMGRNLFDFLQMAKRTGDEVPLEFKKMAEEALKFGTLVGENGEQLTDLNGISWAETFSQSIDRVVSKLDELIRKITGDLGGALETTAGQAGRLTGERVDESPVVLGRRQEPDYHAALGGMFSGPLAIGIERGRKEMVGDEHFFEGVLSRVFARRRGNGGGGIQISIGQIVANTKEDAGAIADELVRVLPAKIRASGQLKTQWLEAQGLSTAMSGLGI